MLAKLLEVDSQLAAQETELSAKLQDIQDKRRSLKTVISMFTLADTPIATATVAEKPAQTPTVETGSEPEPMTEDLATLELETSQTTASAESNNKVVPENQPQKAKNFSSSASRKQTKKSTQAMKTARKTENWQDYLREEFSQTTLPEAVSKVLQRQSEQVLEIPAIVDAIFMDDIPPAARIKGRRQITNILSEGARKSKWYRGQPGGYTMSKAAAEAVNSAS
jgi:CRISPR/Cas system-associated endonuclease/helicase Cas3